MGFTNCDGVWKSCCFRFLVPLSVSCAFKNVEFKLIVPAAMSCSSVPHSGLSICTFLYYKHTFVAKFAVGYSLINFIFCVISTFFCVISSGGVSTKVNW